MANLRMQLTTELQERLCRLIRTGSMPLDAANVVGIPETIFETWMRWGAARKPMPQWRDFRMSVIQAAALAQCRRNLLLLASDPQAWQERCRLYEELVAMRDYALKELHSTFNEEFASEFEAAT